MASQCPCARVSGRCVGQEPGSPGHGRRDYADPETDEVVHDLSEDERACPVCDAAYEPFGEETSPQIDWQVRASSASFTAAPATGAVAGAPERGSSTPRLGKGGLFTTQFLARLFHEKYVLGRPMERNCATLAAEGLDMSKGTLAGGLRAVSGLLAPLDEVIRDRNAKAAHSTSASTFDGLTEPLHLNVPVVVYANVDTLEVRAEGVDDFHDREGRDRSCCRFGPTATTAPLTAAPGPESMLPRRAVVAHCGLTDFSEHASALPR